MTEEITEQKIGQKIAVDAYHSQEQQAVPRVEAEAKRDAAITAAMALYDAGDDGARIKLFDAGIESVEAYLKNWA